MAQDTQGQPLMRVILVAAVVAAIVTVAISQFGSLLGLQGAAGGGLAQKDLEQTIRDYLVKNPDVLIAMQTELERKQIAEQKSLREKAINENAAELFHSDASLIAGNPDGDVTVVEFFDYNCGYCRRAFKDLAKLIETDKNVRVVLKEFPIFGKPSEEVAKISIATAKQGKYFEFHRALLAAPGRATKEQALKVAEKIGLDVKRLEKDMNSPDVAKQIQDTAALADRMGLQGTPFYLVGDRSIPGAPDNLYDMFVESVADVRKNGCTATC